MKKSSERACARVNENKARARERGEHARILRERMRERVRIYMYALIISAHASAPTLLLLPRLEHGRGFCVFMSNNFVRYLFTLD